ncbi:LysR family transcriptional regulator [Shimia ponticola]|uniref:LysR family transcriptional regulator n=1 Tax=Shimia ponticola TaxID=2582893 RepID=UPI0011BF47A4|nr:LysR family transcriptional regulator [Shimia ponticola]
MNDSIRSLDWALVQAFLAVAEEGSLSAAARRTGASQPTVGRQIKAIEEALKSKLFARHARGFELTDMGEAILPAARAMAQAMNDIRVAAATRETELAGSVRITASVNVSHALLPPLLARVRESYPGIQIDLVSTDDSENLLFGASDIAIRMYRPTQLDLVTQYLGDLPLGLYGAKSYLERVGRPNGVTDVLKMDLVGHDTLTRIVDGIRGFGYPITREDFATRTDDVLTMWELVVAGCGLGFSPCVVADADPRVERVQLPVAIPSLPMWLTASEAMRATPRIRAVWDLIAAEFPRLTAS